MERNKFKNRLLLLTFILTLSVGYAQFTNVLISDINSPVEPAIAINPNNTNIMFAATNSNNIYASTNSGLTWSEDTLSSSLGVFGDASLLIDNDGYFYYFHLSNPSNGSWLDRIVCQKSTDNGVTFDDGTYFGLNGAKDQDKEWVIMDRDNETIYATWTEFDKYGDPDPVFKSRILFTKSTDLGATWSSPIKINKIDGDCIDSDETTEGAVPAVGPNGEIYTAWSGPAGIRFNRSLDFGTTWLVDPILVDTQPTGWDYGISGIYRANGLPITLCDLSDGPYIGTIYVNWSDQRNGEDDTDVWLKKSTDGGNTWSDLKRVNNDSAGNQQFFTWMAIDQITGYLYCVFYDRRNHTNDMTDVYLARSTDGGESFTNIKISETPFLPTENVFFGDYTNIAAHNGIIRPIWTSLHNGDLKVWTALIDDATLSVSDEFDISFDLHQNFPNPAKDETYVAFKLKNTSKMSLVIYDTKGNLIASVLKNQTLNLGKHIIKIPLKKYNLQNGLYYYILQSETSRQIKKMIIK